MCIDQSFAFDFNLTLKVISLVKYKKKLNKNFMKKNSTKKKKLPVYNMLSISEFIWSLLSR